MNQGYRIWPLTSCASSRARNASLHPACLSLLLIDPFEPSSLHALIPSVAEGPKADFCPAGHHAAGHIPRVLQARAVTALRYGSPRPGPRHLCRLDPIASRPERQAVGRQHPSTA